MISSSMTCGRALTILLSDPDERDRDELRHARLHASRCPRCSSAYAPADHGAGALRHLPGRGVEPATPLRVGLVVIAVTQLVFAIPWLVGRSLLPDAHVAVSHLTRDGALGIVIAALGFVTAWRPRYVHSTMIIGLLVFTAQIVGGLADQQTSSVSVSFEIVHALVVITVFGMFGVAANMARRATPQAQPRSPVLRSRALR